MEPTWLIIDTSCGDVFIDLDDKKHTLSSDMCVGLDKTSRLTIECGIGEKNMCLILTKKTALAVKKFLEINL